MHVHKHKRPSLTVCTSWSGTFLWVFLNLSTDGPTSTSERVKNFNNFLEGLNGVVAFTVIG